MQKAQKEAMWKIVYGQNNVQSVAIALRIWLLEMYG